MKNVIALVCGVSWCLGCTNSATSSDAGAGDVADAGRDDVADASGRDVADVPLSPSHRAAAPRTQWVHPWIGTGGLGYGVGSTFPGPQRPFGMARPGPDTASAQGAIEFMHCAGYSYADDRVLAFSQARMHGTGIADYGHIGLMPALGMSAEKTTDAGHALRFIHGDENATVGYYRVVLEGAITAELTATDHVGMHRYTFPPREDATVIVDLAHSLPAGRARDAHATLDPVTGEVSGWAHLDGSYSERFGGMRVYFVARPSRVPTAHGTWNRAGLQMNSTEAAGAPSGVWMQFDTRTTSTVTVAVGLSYTDLDHARMNLDAEARDGDFDRVRRESIEVWERALSVVDVDGRADADFSMMYTALYHAMLMPTASGDVDGTYRGIDGMVHHAEGFRYYTDFSLWDTFRTLHPLLTLVAPDRQRDMLRSLMAMAEQRGSMPRWPLGTGETGGMVGESADVVFADSYVKGIRDFDLRAAYGLLRRTAVPGAAPMGVSPREDLDAYATLGWVPIEAGDKSASVTLEYAYDDRALARLAEAAGETADAAMLLARSRNWRNLYDRTTGFLLGRRRDGSFPTVVSDRQWQDWYAEGTAWQYMFYAPHDLDGLAEVYGGRDALLGRVAQMFDNSSEERRTALPPAYYWHGNEPDLVNAYVFAALDDPSTTATWARWALRANYRDAPDGLAGNDDGGTLSAWFVFSAMGLFPIAGEPYYLVGSPIFTRTVLHLPGGNVEIDAANASESAMYVQRATLDGAALTRPRVDHSALAHGATLRLEMGAQAVTRWQ